MHLSKADSESIATVLSVLKAEGAKTDLNASLSLLWREVASEVFELRAECEAGATAVR